MVNFGTRNYKLLENDQKYFSIQKFMKGSDYKSQLISLQLREKLHEQIAIDKQFCNKNDGNIEK